MGPCSRYGICLRDNLGNIQSILEKGTPRDRVYKTEIALVSSGKRGYVYGVGIAEDPFMRSVYDQGRDTAKDPRADKDT